MEFRDLKAQYQALKPKIDEAVIKVMTDSNFISGSQVTELEKRLAAYVGVKHCITCGNGTDALTLALMSIGAGPGDAVFVPDFTFFASAETPAVLGATPVFVDVCEDTFNMAPESLRAEIERVKVENRLRLKAVIPVDLFGLPADYQKLCKIAHENGMTVIEDGAQGFGGTYVTKRACSFGDISTTSFFPAKPLGCYGDGGAVFTDNDNIANLIRSLAIHGKGSDKYDNIRLGMNSRLDTVQAAILNVKMDAFEQYELKTVNKAAEWYTQRLYKVVVVPVIPQHFGSSWAQYTIRLDNRKMRDELQIELKQRGIPSMIYYPKLMHQQSAFADLPYHNQSPNAEKLCETVLSLPIHPYLSEDAADQICTEISNILK